jgi:hydrogenase-4 membrane subunit HyfE
LKKLGIFLILAGILCVLAFILYTIILVPEIPLLIKFGISAAIVGLVIVIAALVYERSFKKKRSDEDDYSKY